MKRVVAWLGVSLSIFLALPSLASAIEYGGVGGRPANPQPNNPRTQSIFIYELKPGASASDGVKVFNNTNSTRTITIDAVDSVLSSGGAFACAQAADQKSDVGSWITLSTTNITLPAGGSQVVPFTVTVPASAGVGEHDGCVTIQDISATTNVSGKSGVVLGFRSAMRVVVTVPGKIVKKLSLTGVTVHKAKDGNFIVVPVAKNDGNVSLDTKVTASFAPVFAVTSPNTHGTYPVLPYSTASWNLEIKPPFWGGWYHAHATVSYNSNPTALLGQSQGAQKTEMLNSAVFFAAPSPGAIVIEVIVLIIIAVLVWIYVRKRRDIRHIRQKWEEYTAKDKDTLADIAKTHHVSWKKLARVNKLKPPYSLKNGQKLKVPPKPKQGE